MKSLIVIGMLAVLPVAVEAQNISPRQSVLFQPTPISVQSTSTATASGKKNRLSPTIFGAVIFGVAAGAVVYEADAGPSDAKLPIIVGASVVGGLLGYLIGGMLGSSE